MKKTLIYGYGNPGRQDDALGVMLAERTEEWLKSNENAGVETDSNYQLNIEDAERISHFDRVIFADASKEEHIEHFEITQLEPSAKVEFTMHAVSPAFIMHLCQSIYGRTPEAWLVHIRGYEWELSEGLTQKASINLEASLQAVQSMI